MEEKIVSTFAQNQKEDKLMECIVPPPFVFRDFLFDCIDLLAASPRAILNVTQFRSNLFEFILSINFNCTQLRTRTKVERHVRIISSIFLSHSHHKHERTHTHTHSCKYKYKHTMYKQTPTWANCFSMFSNATRFSLRSVARCSTVACDCL